MPNSPTPPPRETTPLPSDASIPLTPGEIDRAEGRVAKLKQASDEAKDTYMADRSTTKHQVYLAKKAAYMTAEEELVVLREKAEGQAAARKIEENAKEIARSREIAAAKRIEEESRKIAKEATGRIEASVKARTASTTSKVSKNTELSSKALQEEKAKKKLADDIFGDSVKEVS